MIDEEMDIFVVVGPTAIGKTKFAIELALKVGAEIINADSVQVYKEMNIGSAKPTMEELAKVKHHLVDFVSVDQEFTVADFQELARTKIDQLLAQNKKVVVCGGTGLYINALLYNYKFGESLEQKVYRQKLANLPLNDLQKLAQTFTGFESIDLENQHRLISFISKKKFDMEIQTAGQQKYYQNFQIIGLKAPREVIYERINQRVDQMFETGLLEEVKKFERDLPSQKAIGYKEVHMYLNQEIDYDEMIELIKRNTRRFAKRQMTWFNNKISVLWYNIIENNYEK